ncbi:MAG: hypothetical protein EA397_07345 [Deltaproteobacteria bacterium]|nr:MAG: hypothetical protein EA397_07345 [Deltaproteobacteria bacterium]
MRWMYLGLLAIACGGDDFQPGPGGGTGGGESGNWQDLSVSSSATLNAIYVGGTGAFIIGDSGTAWDVAPGLSSPMTTGSTVAMTGVWGTGAGPTAQLLAVGYVGSVFERAGRTWALQDHPALGTANLEDIDGDGEDFTAVSSTGIFRRQGGSWSFETGQGGNLRSVFVEDNGDAWAVGDGGSIVRRESGIWYAVDSPANVDLRGVHGNGEHLVVVGHGGTLLQWDGREFIAHSQRIQVNLQDVWMAPSGVAFVVGNNGTVYRWNPSASGGVQGTLTDISADTSSHLYAVAGSDDRNVWTVGARGTVLRLRPQ